MSYQDLISSIDHMHATMSESGIPPATLDWMREVLHREACSEALHAKVNRLERRLSVLEGQMIAISSEVSDV